MIDQTPTPTSVGRMLSNVSNQTRRYLIGTAAALLVWYFCVLFLWALQPLTDSVPVGIAQATNTSVSQTVTCNTLFASSPRGTDPLPTVQEPLAYTRSACGSVQSQPRLVFAFDTLALLMLLALLVVIAFRARAFEAELGALPAQSAQSTLA